jgi:hypothetical protein
MIEEKFTRETDSAVQEFISSRVVRHTVQLFKKGSPRLEPFGTSVFVKIYDQYFLFTASHVADYFEQNQESDLYIRVGKKRFVNVLGEIKYTDINKSKGVDLAYIKLDSQLYKSMLGPYIPLEISKIRSHHNLPMAMNYCVLGFPEINITKPNEEFDTGATVYLTRPSTDKVYNYYKYSKSDTIVLDMQGKGEDLKTNDNTKVNTHFYGISGCGLWLMLIHFNEKTNKPEIDYRLVGIMTEFKKGKYFCLTANKIYLLIEALKVREKFQFKEIAVKYT